MRKAFLFCLTSVLLYSCRTVDLEKNYNKYQPEMAEVQQEKNVEPVYVEPPETVYVDMESDDKDMKNDTVLTGDDAVKQNLADNTVVPEYTSNHLKSWLYQEGKTYQIQCQTFHSTVIQLEPGEEMLEVPYVSETDVWRVARGVGVKNGQPCHYVIIKPDYSGLCSTMIIVTNKRIYLMELRSFKDHYMPLVQWVYGNESTIMSLPSYVAWQKQEEEKSKEAETKGIPSGDYKMYYFGKAPVWLPKYVYDNGSKTYFVLDERCLHTELPALFNMKNEIINYRVDTINKNTLVIDQLIEKATLKLGKQKVTIEKKKSSKAAVIESQVKQEETKNDATEKQQTEEDVKK